MFKLIYYVCLILLLFHYLIFVYFLKFDGAIVKITCAEDAKGYKGVGDSMLAKVEDYFNPKLDSSPTALGEIESKAEDAHPLKAKLLNAFRGESDVNVSTLAARVGLSVHEVRDALENLAEEGSVYPTLEDAFSMV